MEVFRKNLILLTAVTLFISSLIFFFQPLSPFQAIAHRGASAYAPENTMTAFLKAVELGFDYIEFDVRMSKDEELVVIHDPKVDRTTNGEGQVHDFTARELKNLDAGAWYDEKFSGESIPLLSEVLEELGGKIGLLIELKSPESYPNMAEKLATLLQDSFNHGLNPQLIKVQSFHADEIRRFSSLMPDVSVGIVTKKNLNLFQLTSYRYFASFISVHHQHISRPFISLATALDFEVYAWTIKKQSQFLVLQSQSVHGIISNLEKKEQNYPRILAALYYNGQVWTRFFA